LDKAYQNAQVNSGKQNARLKHDKALGRMVLELLRTRACGDFV
jgi:type I restriction enzyme R subunit